MKKLQRRTLLLALFILPLYPGAYIILVDTGEPSLSAEGDPVYRSSYPWLVAPSVRWRGPMDLFFQRAGIANRVFLPVDKVWRRVRGLPPSVIGESGKFWLEYFDRKAEYGRIRGGNKTLGE